MSETSSSIESNDHLEGDREFDSVASNNGPNKLIAGLVFSAVSIFAIAVIAGNIKEEAPKLMTDSSAEEFNDNRSSSTKPFFDFTTEATAKIRDLAPTQRPDPQQLMELQKIALEAAQKEEARMRKRLHSKIIVHDRNNLNSAASHTPQIKGQQARAEALLDKAIGGLSQINSGTITPVGSDTVGGISKTGSIDPNTAWAEANEAREYKVSFAQKIKDLDYTVSQGTLIDAVLETAIQSDLPGQVRAIIAQPIFSMDQSRILIPRGSRLVGQYKSQLRQGQSRVFILWDRLIRSDGITVSISSTGTDELGRSGVSGFYDSHFWDRFGAAIMLSIVDSALEVAINEANENSNDITFSSGGGIEDAASIALKNSINRSPTIYVDQGERVKVFLQKDLNFKIAELAD